MAMSPITVLTLELVRKFAPRVRHLYKTNGGQASAFNASIPGAPAVSSVLSDDYICCSGPQREVDPAKPDQSIPYFEMMRNVNGRPGRVAFTKDINRNFRY